MSGYEKLVLVTRKTRLQELVERFNSRGQARFYIEHAGGRFAEYEEEDAAYRRALDATRSQLRGELKLHVLERTLLPTFLFARQDLVLVLGQDGLVANVAKYTGQQPIIALNPDPARHAGVLLPYRPEDAARAVASVIAGRERIRRVTLAEAALSDGQRLLAFNDLFIGVRTHTSARYRLEVGDHHEVQSSSGIIVSTGAGATGWLSSVYQMAARLARDARVTAAARPRFAWEDRRLAFVVREPYPGSPFQAELVDGLVEERAELVVESLMPAGGVIFSDGMEDDFLQFSSGSVARIRAAQQHACLAAPA